MLFIGKPMGRSIMILEVGAARTPMIFLDDFIGLFLSI